MTLSIRKKNLPKWVQIFMTPCFGVIISETPDKQQEVQ